MPQTFPIAPADLRWLWLIAAVPVVVGFIVVYVLASSIGGARSSQFEVSAEGLRLDGDFYGRLVPASELRVDGARRVDFTRDPGLLPGRKTMGTGMRGYQAGWYNLQNGERALLYLTDRSRAVYIPTSAGYSILVSPIDPDGFLAALTAIRSSR